MAHNDVAIGASAKQIEDVALYGVLSKEQSLNENQKTLARQNIDAMQFFEAYDDELYFEKTVDGIVLRINPLILKKADVNIEATNGIEVVDSVDENDNPIKVIKLTEEAYKKVNEILVGTNGIEIEEIVDENGFIERKIKLTDEIKNLIDEISNKADKKSWKLIQTIKCDGTKANYSKSGLNLSALKLVCSTEVGEKSFAGRLNINNITFAFFSNYVTKAKKYMFATVDLNNLTTQKGIGTANTEIPATENASVIDDMLTMESITYYDFGSYADTQYIPANSVIEIYGKEK